MSEQLEWQRPASPQDQATVEREREYWDQHEDLDWVTDSSKCAAIALIPRVTGDVLELCIGSGTYSRAVPRDYRSYTGVDISQSLLDALKARQPGVVPVKGNAEDLVFEDQTFDSVLVFAGLHHLPRYQRAIAESHRVLRPGGYFYCFEPNDRAWYRTPMRFLRKFIGIYSDDEIWLDAADVVETMRRVGFRDPRVDYLTPRFKPGHLSAKNEVLARMMYAAAALGRSARTQSFVAISAQKPDGEPSDG